MAVAVAAPHAGGTAALTASQASGYWHPATGVAALAVSCWLNQPFPTSTVFLGVGVKDGGDRVGIVPVGVYVGNKFTAATALIDAGGQGKFTVEEGAMDPAPAPPVIQGWKVPSKSFPETPSELHIPTAFLGSRGIQPFCKPSWYDQRGDSTMPAVELPTFHVQKNQF